MTRARLALSLECPRGDRGHAVVCAGKSWGSRVSDDERRAREAAEAQAAADAQKEEAAERLAEKRKAERARTVKTHLTKARTSLKAGRFTQPTHR